MKREAEKQTREYEKLKLKARNEMKKGNRDASTIYAQ